MAPVFILFLFTLHRGLLRPVTCFPLADGLSIPPEAPQGPEQQNGHAGPLPWHQHHPEDGCVF